MEENNEGQKKELRPAAPATLVEALAAYEKASARAASRAGPGASLRAVLGEAQRQVHVLELVGAVADLARAGGDLAVKAIEELTKFGKDHLEAERLATKRSKKWQAIVIVLGLLFTAATAISGVVQAYFTAHPPPH